MPVTIFIAKSALQNGIRNYTHFCPWRYQKKKTILQVNRYITNWSMGPTSKNFKFEI